MVQCSFVMFSISINEYKINTTPRYDPTKTFKSLQINYLRFNKIETMDIIKFAMIEDPRRHSEHSKLSCYEALVTHYKINNMLLCDPSKTLKSLKQLMVI